MHLQDFGLFIIAQQLLFYKMSYFTKHSQIFKKNLNGFVTQWLIPSAAFSVTLPFVNTRTEGALSYNCIVNWGDGTTTTVTSWNDANATHIYALAGTYNIEITGTAEGWSFNGTSAVRTRITKVLSWGNATLFNGFKYLSGGFNGCTALTDIPTNEKIPASGTGVLSQGFANLFLNCTSLGTGKIIPTGLFDNHTLAVTFASTFSGNKWTGIPTDLFRYNTSVTTFSATFSNCTLLPTIPDDTFRYNTSVTTFFNTFNGSGLTVINVDLFRYNVLVTNFQQTFLGTRIVSIPTDLFRYNTLVTTFSFSSNGCFKNCTLLTTVPTDLFRYNTAVTGTGMGGLFEGCSSLATIPTDLFRYNTLITSAQNMFRLCISLASVPTNLFKYNTAITAFAGTFQFCYKLEQNANIFYSAGEQATRFAGKTVNFTNCFDIANPINFTGIQGVAPDLWNCTFTASTKTLCWQGHNGTTVSNYANIPVAWR